MISSCPGCGKYYTPVLSNPWLIVCPHCHEQISGPPVRSKSSFAMPDDLSTIQIGTTGTYREQSFTITGRIRFQLKTDFRNLWCAHYGGKTIWIAQSLESIGFFDSHFTRLAFRFEDLRAGVYMEFSDKIKVKCELMEPCIQMHYEGEIAKFPLADEKVTLLQAGNALGNTALLFKDKYGDLHYLWGKIMLVYGYKFSNLKSQEEWMTR